MASEVGRLRVTHAATEEAFWTHPLGKWLKTSLESDGFLNGKGYDWRPRCKDLDLCQNEWTITYLELCNGMVLNAFLLYM